METGRNSNNAQSRRVGELQADVQALRAQVHVLRDELDASYETEATSKSYISILKGRCRALSESCSRYRELEEENRRLRRILDGKSNDTATQREKIEYLTDKLVLMEGERNDLKAACGQFQTLYDNINKNMESERTISQGYYRKLEGRYRSELAKNQIWSQRYAQLACQSQETSQQQQQEPEGSSNKRRILINPAHPAYEDLLTTLGSQSQSQPPAPKRIKLVEQTHDSQSLTKSPEEGNAKAGPSSAIRNSTSTCGRASGNVKNIKGKKFGKGKANAEAELAQAGSSNGAKMGRRESLEDGELADEDSE